MVTSQEWFDSYEWAGALIAVQLVNALALDHAFGRPNRPVDAFAAVQGILASDPTWPPLRERDIPGLVGGGSR